MIVTEENVEILHKAIATHLPDAKFYTSGADLVWIGSELDPPTDEQLQSWIDSFEPDPDWDRLQSGSALFLLKAKSTSNATSFALLVSTITTIRNPLYLKMALDGVIPAMGTPYSESELEALQELLNDCHMGVVLSES
jgi:hypothetical protein